MGMFNTLASGTLALFISVLGLKHSTALDEAGTFEIFSCDDLPEAYDDEGATTVHLKGDMTCPQNKVRSRYSSVSCG